MARSSPKGVNTIFKQTAKALRAARQTQVFSRVKRNIPYLNKFSGKSFVINMRKKLSKNSKNKVKITKKLSKFAKKIK
jgi:hypothetical protein